MLPANAMSAPPTFSVIVACRNPGQRLREACASVWSQEGAAAELVVVDGHSTDGSLAWLEASRSRLGALVTGRDAGVYDALNHGVAAARGAWVLFLGADDRLAGPRVLADAASALRADGRAVLVGEARYDDGRVYRLAARPRPIARNFAHHQATFYPRALLVAPGPFDPGLAVMGDYDLNLRLLRRGVPFLPLPLRVAECGTGGLSDRGDWRGYAEEIAVRRRHFGGAAALPWDAAAVLRHVRKRIVRRRRTTHG